LTDVTVTLRNSWISQTVKGELSGMDKLHRQLGALRTFRAVESCKGSTAWVTILIMSCNA